MGRLEVEVSLPLDRFDLAVGFVTERPVTGIFGSSGAGKSSLLEAIAGLRRGATGAIRFDGRAWLDSARGVELPPERRGVGYVPQEGLLFPHLTVRDNLLAGARRARRNGARAEASLERVAALLELEPLLGQSARTLSGGERQRVALGRALCSGPRILLLDEPLAALDLPLRRRLLPLLRRVRAELTLPMLLVSHDPIEVQALCDEVVVLRDGRAAGHGAPVEVLTDPEIFPLSSIEAFVNVLPGRVVGHRDGAARVGLGGGAELVTVSSGGRIGEEVLVGLPANQILLATEPPRGLSARNALAATLTAIRPVGAASLARVSLDGGLPPLVVELTRATPGELGLEPGGRVYLVIKASACRLFGAG